jgi:hypothetical protein
MDNFFINRGNQGNPLVRIPFGGTLAGAVAEAKSQFNLTGQRTWVTAATQWEPDQDDPHLWDSKWDVKPVAEGTKHFGDGEAWLRWAVFPASVADEVARGHFPIPNGFWAGPGQGFAKKASVRRSRTRVLVTQLGGLDI